MAQIGSPSAGWYTDPSGQHRARYWDGASWTEQVRDDLNDQVDPGAPGGAHTAANTVAGVAEAVAAVAANDIIRPGDGLVVDYGTDGPWGSTPGAGTVSDPFAPAPPPRTPPRLRHPSRRRRRPARRRCRPPLPRRNPSWQRPPWTRHR